MHRYDILKLTRRLVNVLNGDERPDAGPLRWMLDVADHRYAHSRTDRPRIGP